MGTGTDARSARKETSISDIELSPGKSLRTSCTFLDTKDLSGQVVDRAADELLADGAEVIVASGAYSVDDPADELKIQSALNRRDVLVTCGHGRWPCERNDFGFRPRLLSNQPWRCRTVRTRALSHHLGEAVAEVARACKAHFARDDLYGKGCFGEELLGMPFGDVWDEYCRRDGVPLEDELWDKVKSYEDDVLSKRG